MSAAQAPSRQLPSKWTALAAALSEAGTSAMAASKRSTCSDVMPHSGCGTERRADASLCSQQLRAGLEERVPGEGSRRAPSALTQASRMPLASRAASRPARSAEVTCSVKSTNR
ncbi:hypothetical protein NKH18_23930 [Streptomyces sp. M10(2022)]